MLYTKLLRESLEASCVGDMLQRLPADSSYLWGYMQEHQVATSYAYYSYFVYFCTMVLFCRIRIHYLAYYSGRI